MTRSAHALRSLAVAFLLAGCAASPPAPEPAPKHAPPNPAPSLATSPSTIPGSVAAAETKSAATAAPDAAAAPAASADARAYAVAQVGDGVVELGELLAALLHHESPRLRAHLARLVEARMARFEAERLGLAIAEPEIERRVAGLRGQIERELRTGGSRLALEEWLLRERGLDPARFFEILRSDAEDQMLVERVVRAWFWSRGWARVRVIVTEDEEALASVRTGLANGEDFAALARAHSLDATAEEGGLIPALVKTELSPFSLLAFHTEPGQVGGPVDIQDGAGQMLMLVEERHEPVEGSWAEVGASVERSLAERPIDEAEYNQWQIYMERRYTPTLRGLFELAGEPLP